MVRLFLFLQLIAISGCAASFLNPLPKDIPEGAEVVRCTKYEGMVGGIYTGSTTKFSGCQCVRLGKTSGELIVDITDCSAVLGTDNNG